MAVGWARECFLRSLWRGEWSFAARWPTRPIRGARRSGWRVRWLTPGVPTRGGEKTIENGATAIPEKARRFLQAAAVEAFGRPGAYVIQDQVMRRAGVADPEEFRTIAAYLNERGWIADADDDYGIFVVTAAGVEEATR
ncbi:MAG: hypothetical protein H0T57_13770 [Rubrobacter sp.]|nr:hypothetical protein [Rubrobacter sp.]